MARLTIRNLDDAVKARLRVRAAEHGRSMEAEARAILCTTLGEAQQHGAGTWIHELFADLELGDLEIPSRTEPVRATSFDD